MGRRHHHHCDEEVNYDERYVDHSDEDCSDRAGGTDRYHDYEYYAQERAYSNQTGDYYDKSHEYESLKKQQGQPTAYEQYVNCKRLGITDRVYKSSHTKKPLHMSKAERKEYEKLECERLKAEAKKTFLYIFKKKKYKSIWDMPIIDFYLYGREEFMKKYGPVTGSFAWLISVMGFTGVWGAIIWYLVWLNNLRNS